jgi:predicted acyl esterase
VSFDSVINTLPLSDIPKRIGSAPSDLDDFMTWPLSDPRWKTIEFGNEGDRNGAPALYINAWYDVSTGPNLAMFNYQTKNAATQQARDNTFMIVAPTSHCQMGRVESENFVIGERNVGDARYDYAGLHHSVVRPLAQGRGERDRERAAGPSLQHGRQGLEAVRHLAAGGGQKVTYFLDSDGGANTAAGNGAASSSPGRRKTPSTPTPMTRSTRRRGLGGPSLLLQRRAARII